jgi:hypothetical protein
MKGKKKFDSFESGTGAFAPVLRMLLMVIFSL